jgi:hypothetical protein
MEPGNSAQEGRFTGAVGPDYPHHLTLADRKADAPYRFELAVADREIAHLEQGVHCASELSRSSVPR